MLAGVQKEGFVVRKGLAPDLSTMEVAQGLGVTLNVEEIFPAAGVAVVQSLRPRDTTHATKNHYSGHFGMGSFPLHTDLAHWAIPPRYLILRCKVGTPDVFTELLHWSRIIGLVGKATLQKAVFRSRKSRNGFSGLVRALSHYDHTELFRWDSLFLKPLNQHAEKLVAVMADMATGEAPTRVLLSDPGDTVLIDNWKMLHGRSAVPNLSKDRHVERAYLTEVYQ